MHPWHPDTAFTGAPGSLLGSRRLIWLLWAGLVMGGLITTAWAVSARVIVPSHKVFLGELRPSQSPTLISLPAGIPLEQIVVTQGQKVRAGEVIAVLDRPLIEMTLTAVERRILTWSVQRMCLSQAKHSPSDLLEKIDVEAEARILIQAALQTCENNQATLMLRLDRLAGAEAALEASKTILDQKFTLLLGANDAANGRAQHYRSVTEALNLTAQKHAITARQRALNLEARALRIDTEEDRLMRLQAVNQSLFIARREQDLLLKYLANPRLIAPHSGLIERIRLVAAGATLPHAVDIVEIADTAVPTYATQFRASLSEGQRLIPGTPVQISLLGMRKDKPPLVGHILSIRPSQDRLAVDVDVILQAESIAAISDPQSGLALHGENTASAISVQMEQTSLRSALQRAVPSLSLMHWIATDFQNIGVSDARLSDAPLQQSQN